MRRSGAVAVLALSAAYCAGVLWHHTDATEGIVAYDFYGQFYPWQLYARRAWSSGGLLWNPYQDCGQVLLANIQTALLYPVNWLFLFLPRQTALLSSVFFNVLVAGAGMFLLCRTLTLQVTAALSAALAFQLGWAVTQVTSWSPTHGGTFVWIPVALWCAERSIRAPSTRNGLLMSLCLALQILGGFPQMVMLTYQIIALRIGWALLLRQAPAVSLLSATLVGFLGAPLLSAIQLLPALETVRDSLWGAPLSAAALGKPVPLLLGLANHVAIAANPLFIVMGCVALAVAWRTPQRATMGFYALITVLYFLFHLGPGTFFFDLYASLPPAGAFRAPARLLWITNTGLAVLVGFAVNAIAPSVSPPPGGGEVRGGLQLALLVLIAAVAVQAISVRGFTVADSAIALLLAAAVAMRALRPFLAVILPSIVVLNVLVAGQPPLFTLRSGDVYATHTALFEKLRARMTAQDRMLIVGVHPDLGLMPKSGTVLALPNIHDYDPMVLRTYAEYFTFMRTGRTYREMEDWYWLFGKLLTDDIKPPLLDLTAARYLVVDHRLSRIPLTLAPRMKQIDDDGGVTVYENAGAQPRARYVADLEVVPAKEILERLADGSATRVVLADHAPRSGFTGTATGTGMVTFVADTPQHIALRVHATAPGFVVLADAWAPGWTAQVNGAAAEIVRANHTFRAVEVPAGDSTVEFSYAPLTVRLGALVTLLSAAATVCLWRLARIKSA